MQRFTASLNQKMQTEGAKEEGGGGARGRGDGLN